MVDPNLPVNVPAAQIAAKFNSKREIFNLLTVSVQCYLSHHENFNIYFLKAICSGAKRCKCIHGV